MWEDWLQELFPGFQLWTNKTKTHSTQYYKDEHHGLHQKNQRWTQVLATVKQFLLLTRHPPCYSYMRMERPMVYSLFVIIIRNNTSIGNKILKKKLTMRDKKRRRSASGGVNQIWILKNSKELIEYTQSRSLSFCNSIKTFDISPLYTPIQHSNL